VAGGASGKAVGGLRLLVLAVVVGLVLTLWWTSTYPNTPMTSELYGLFAFVGFVVGSLFEWIFASVRRRGTGGGGE